MIQSVQDASENIPRAMTPRRRPDTVPHHPRHGFPIPPGMGLPLPLWLHHRLTCHFPQITPHSSNIQTQIPSRRKRFVHAVPSQQRGVQDTSEQGIKNDQNGFEEIFIDFHIVRNIQQSAAAPGYDSDATLNSFSACLCRKRVEIMDKYSNPVEIL